MEEFKAITPKSLRFLLFEKNFYFGGSQELERRLWAYEELAWNKDWSWSYVDEPFFAFVKLALKRNNGAFFIKVDVFIPLSCPLKISLIWLCEWLPEALVSQKQKEFACFETYDAAEPDHWGIETPEKCDEWEETGNVGVGGLHENDWVNPNQIKLVNQPENSLCFCKISPSFVIFEENLAFESILEFPFWTLVSQRHFYNDWSQKSYAVAFVWNWATLQTTKEAFLLKNGRERLDECELLPNHQNRKRDVDDRDSDLSIEKKYDFGREFLWIRVRQRNSRFFLLEDSVDHVQQNEKEEFEVVLFYFLFLDQWSWEKDGLTILWTL